MKAAMRPAHHHVRDVARPEMSTFLDLNAFLRNRCTINTLRSGRPVANVRKFRRGRKVRPTSPARHVGDGLLLWFPLATGLNQFGIWIELERVSTYREMFEFSFVEKTFAQRTSCLCNLT